MCLGLSNYNTGKKGIRSLMWKISFWLLDTNWRLCGCLRLFFLGVKGTARTVQQLRRVRNSCNSPRWSNCNSSLWSSCNSPIKTAVTHPVEAAVTNPIVATVTHPIETTANHLIKAAVTHPIEAADVVGPGTGGEQGRATAERKIAGSSQCCSAPAAYSLT